MDLHIRAAYGRKYATREAAIADWFAGKDFQVIAGEWRGSYCSIDDTQAILADGYKKIWFWDSNGNGDEILEIGVMLDS